MGSSGPGKGLVCVVPLVGGQWAALSSAENRNYLRNYDTEIPIRYRYTGIPPGKRYRKSYRSVNDNLTHGRPHHRWHHARHPRAPTAVAPTQPTATPAVLAAPTAVGRAPPRMPQPSRLSVVAGPAALETAAPSSQPTSATASASTAAVRNRYHRRPHYRRRHAPAAAPAPPPPPSAATGGVRRRRLR